MLRRPMPFAFARLSLFCAAAGLLLVATAAESKEPSGGSTITGLVRDRQGDPISRAFLQIEGRRDRAGTMPWQVADAEGRFELESVPEGAVRLRAVAGDSTLFPEAGKVVETHAGVRDLVIVLETGRELRLQVKKYDPRGLEPIPGARLIWGAGPGAVIRGYRWAPIAADGSIRFVQLPDAQSFEVWGRAGLDAPFKASDLTPGSKVNVISPTSGLAISGRVIPTSVAVDDHPTVYAEAYHGFIAAEGRVNQDGTFVIRDLPEGTYVVGGELRSARRDGVQASPKSVRAGATDVVLDFSPPGK
jgi:hypothetical protein